MKTFIKLTNVSLKFQLFNNKPSLRKYFFDFFKKNKLSNINFKALNKINLEINEGDRVGVIGSNGSGKSTLLRVLSGIYPVSEGSINLSGSCNSLIDIFSGIDYNASGYENILLRGMLIGHSKKEIVDLAPSIIKISGLEDYIYSPVRTYSSGMLMRLAFFVTLSKPCQIVIMDEWLSVGDENFKKISNKFLLEYLSKSNIFIIATHSKELLEEMTDKVIWLEKGDLVKFDKTEVIVREYFN